VYGRKKVSGGRKRGRRKKFGNGEWYFQGVSGEEGGGKKRVKTTLLRLKGKRVNAEKQKGETVAIGAITVEG